MRKIFFFAIAFSFISGVSFSQEKLDTLWFMNGETLNVKVTDTLLNPEQVTCKYMKRKKEREMKIDKERLFSIKFSDSTEKIYYVYDTMQGNIFTVEETRYFVLGERDALKGYRPTISLVCGIAVGLGSPIALAGTIISTIPVLAFGAASSKLPKVKVNTKKIASREYLKKDTYLLGYERVARKKKMFSALAGGTAGLAAGFVLYFTLFNDKAE